MKQYNKINNLVGWLTFAVAAFTYCMTIEPTASFWDCRERVGNQRRGIKGKSLTAVVDVVIIVLIISP